MSSPPARNFGSVAPASASGTPSAMPPAPRTSSAPGQLQQPVELREQPGLGPSRPRGTPGRARATTTSIASKPSTQLRVGHRAQARGEACGPATPASRDSWSTTPRTPSPANSVTADAPGATPALDRERLPRRALLVLGEAERELAGVAERRPVDLARAAAADVADDELQRAADGRVGAVALPERVDAAVHADAPAIGPVDDRRPARRSTSWRAGRAC